MKLNVFFVALIALSAAAFAGAPLITTDCSPRVSTVNPFVIVHALYYDGTQFTCNTVSLAVNPAAPVTGPSCVSANRVEFNVTLPFPKEYLFNFSAGSGANAVSASCLVKLASTSQNPQFPEISLLLVPAIAFASLFIIRKRFRRN
jgi:hypothetical protein